MKKAGLVILLLLFALVFCGAGPSPAFASNTPELETLDEIFKLVQEVHISGPDPEYLVDGAIQGLLDSLGDPYTEYMTPQQLKEFSDFLEGDYVGVGVQLQPGEVYPLVVDAIKGTPAARAGLRPGDLVIKVDGADIAGQPLGMVVQQIRGPEGSRVWLTIRREGAGDLEVELTRTNINLPTVSYEILDDGIGYISIDTFGSDTAGEFRKALEELKRRGADKLIIDLRYNPGGMLQAAAQIVECFIERGQVVVSMVERDGGRYVYRTEKDPVAKGMPVVVLINYYSASASEILAAALQDHGVANLVGEQTFGKGTVQTIIPLKSGGALKVTTARYHTPRDRVIDGAGLTPDLQVLTPELQAAVAQRFLKKTEKNKLVINLEKSEALVNGAAVPFKMIVLYRAGEAHLPLRFVFEALGYRVDWQPEEGVIRAAGRKEEIIFYPERRRAAVGGRELPGEQPLLIENEAAYLPVSSLSLLGLEMVQEGGQISIEK